MPLISSRLSKGQVVKEQIANHQQIEIFGTLKRSDETFRVDTVRGPGSTRRIADEAIPKFISSNDHVLSNDN